MIYNYYKLAVVKNPGFLTTCWWTVLLLQKFSHNAVLLDNISSKVLPAQSLTEQEVWDVFCNKAIPFLLIYSTLANIFY